MKRLDNILFDPHARKFWANVNGSLVEISGNSKDGGGVTKVDTLPEQGEEGKIYYNTTTGTYYISDNGKWRTFNETTVITNLDDVPQQAPVEGAQVWNSYVLSPNVFYNIANWDRVPASVGHSTSMVFAFNPTLGIYAGRFTAQADDTNITWPVGVTTPDSVDTTIVNGHTYEFNVWQGVLILVDVTSTEQGGE